MRGIVLHTVGVAGDTSAAAIRRFHMAAPPEGRGWADIGYHFVVRKDGRVEQGRPVMRAGAHTEGANDTLGVVVTGDGDTEAWTSAQWSAVVLLCERLCGEHGWTAENVHGHREAQVRLNAKPTHKTCPGRLVNMDLVRSALVLKKALA